MNNKYDNWTLGIVGAGQLARMMFAASIPMGMNVRIFANKAGESAACAHTTIGNSNSVEDLYSFAKELNVLTFEHEHVNGEVLMQLVERGVNIHPHPTALQYAQDKLLLRQMLMRVDVPQPAWCEVGSEKDLTTFASRFGGRCVVKLPRGGYDGNGVQVYVEEDVHQARLHTASIHKWLEQGALLAEECIDFEYEVAIQMAVSTCGEEALYPPVITVQKDGKCTSVYAPATAFHPSFTHVTDAQNIARKIAKETGTTGILTVEMFYSRERGLLVNELAMRPHNSGHWSIEGAICSQFEQHLRAVSGLPLGSTQMLYPAVVMHNILGRDASLATFSKAWKSEPEVYLHSYGKVLRPGRKMGHITACGGDHLDAKRRADGALARLAK